MATANLLPLYRKGTVLVQMSEESAAKLDLIGEPAIDFSDAFLLLVDEQISGPMVKNLGRTRRSMELWIGCLFPFV